MAQPQPQPQSAPAPYAFTRPFPALTPEQRWHLEVFGYVVVPGAVEPDAVAALDAAIDRLDRDLRAAPGTRVRNASLYAPSAYLASYGQIVEADPAFTAHITDPRQVGLAEELIGGDARIVEASALVNRRDPARVGPEAYGLHRGTDIGYGGHLKDGLFHCSFVKTLTTLRDLGPDDGGTVVVPGSHRIDAPEADVIACALRDPERLIHRFTGPAGSSLLFSETLIHGTGVIRSDRERRLVIAGYGSSHMPYWDHAPMSEALLAAAPEAMGTLFRGRAHWTRGARYRRLDQPADATRHPGHDWRGAIGDGSR
jgi:ectoine hydroxylase-related dioxygenase (phytanoyl-CoA dioxygenase family)